MNEEQIKDIFEQELEKVAQKGGHFSRFGNEFTDYKGYLDCDYKLGEEAMLATIKRVKKSIKDEIVAEWMANNPTDTKSTATARFNAFFGPFFDENMKGNCPNCGTPHYLSPIGLDGINCELCQPED